MDGSDMGRENLPMKEEFEKLAAGGKLTKQHVDALVALTESGYCYHRSWGFGKIANVDTVFGRFTIEFSNARRATRMDMAFAAESPQSQFLSDHIYARKCLRHGQPSPNGGRLHHLDLIKLVLQSFWQPRDNRSNSASPQGPGRHQGRLEEVVGSRQTRIEAGRPFPGAGQKI